MTKPREYWCNWMGMDSSYSTACDRWPKSEWCDLRVYVEKSAYDSLQAELKEMEQSRDNYARAMAVALRHGIYANKAEVKTSLERVLKGLPE